MYSLATAILHRKRSVTGLEQLDIGLMTIEYLFNNFDRGYLVLTHSTLEGEYYLDLETLKQSNYFTTTLNTSVNSWLYLNRNRALPLIEQEPEYEIKYLNYADTGSSGFSAAACHPVSSTTDGYTASDLTALYLSKTGVDASILADHALYTINGLLHPSGEFDQGVRILDGNKSMWKADDNHVGVISFLDVGRVTQVPLKPEMISAAMDGQPLAMEAIINLEEDLTNKLVMFSIGGYLVYNPSVIHVINHTEGIIHLKTNELDLLTKIEQSRKLIHLDALELSVFNEKNGLVDLTELKQDRCILPYLTLPQSFAIIVEADFLGAVKTPIEFTGIYGQYNMPDVNNDIVIDSYQRIIPYFKSLRNDNPLVQDMSCISIKEGHVEAQLIETGDWRDQTLYCHAPTISRVRAHECKKLTLSFYKKIA